MRLSRFLSLSLEEVLVWHYSPIFSNKYFIKETIKDMSSINYFKSYFWQREHCTGKDFLRPNLHQKRIKKSNNVLPICNFCMLSQDLAHFLNIGTLFTFSTFTTLSYFFNIQLTFYNLSTFGTLLHISQLLAHFLNF